MSGIKDYSTTPADNDAAPPNGFPEGMAPASVNDSARQVMADIRSWYEDPAWIDFGDTATYSSGTAFLVSGDKTARYSVGARIRATGTTPFTVYGVIASSSYSAPNTTVTVTWDSGSMDATLSGVAVNMFSKAGVFNSAAFAELAYQTRNLSIPLNYTKGTNIASATTTNIGAATGNFVHITGTTTITAFDTVQAGTVRILTFDGILTLTHNGTSLILPTSANITTAAGDNAIFVSEGSGNWRCVSYNKANGTSLGSLASQLSSLVGFSSYYASSQQSFTLGSVVTVTHSLGGAPTFVQFDLVCTTTDGGYSVGDVITMPCSLRFTSGSGSFTKGMVLGYNATDVFLTIGADTIAWVTKNGASQFNLNVSNWRIVLKAWK